MQVMNERPDQTALTVDKSAATLGLDEFSLMSRIQAGEIKVARATSGEMVIPESELERLAGGPVSAQSVEGGAILPDECLGIERRRGGLKQNGELVLPYRFRAAGSRNARSTATAPPPARLPGNWNPSRISNGN